MYHIQPALILIIQGKIKYKTNQNIVKHLEGKLTDFYTYN